MKVNMMQYILGFHTATNQIFILLLIRAIKSLLRIPNNNYNTNQKVAMSDSENKL